MSLLRPAGLVVYPVTTGGAVRSSVTLKKQDNWQAVAFGAPLAGPVKGLESKVLPDLQHDTPHRAAVRDQAHRLAGALERKHAVHPRAKLAFADPGHDGLRRPRSIFRIALHPGAEKD